MTGHGAIDLPIKEIIAAYESGTSGITLADQYHVSTATLYDRLRKADIELRVQTGDNMKTREARQASSERQSKRIGVLHPHYLDLPTDAIAERYKSRESTEQIAQDYGVCVGTILRRVRAAGVPVRSPGFVDRRECPDGHIADSYYEYEVDKWLSEHLIEHDIHPPVPWWEGGKSPQRADFRVQDIYIEVWGIKRNKHYNRRRQDKIAHYQDCGIELIEIFPHHVIDGDLLPLQALLAFHSEISVD